MTAHPLDPPVTLADKYLREEGRVFLTGVQALVRLPLMQRRLDRAAGLDTAGFISGYRGSPLGTYDRELWAAEHYLAAEQIRFQPGLNEDLAATSVWGTQQVGLFAGARHDGVFALWYAKSPGVDRSGDVLKHANAAGTAALGGVLALAGDDHACKSASLPSQSDYALLDASIPVLHPASVAEIIRFGLVGWAMSRRCGLWVGLKALADTIDSAASIDLKRLAPPIAVPEGPAGDVSIRWPDSALDQERRLFDIRLPAAVAFGRANRLNRLLVDPGRGRRLVILAVGKSAPDVRQALAALGLDEAAMGSLGIALAAIGMPWPLDPEFAVEVCRGAEEVLVVEEKRPLVEDQLARILFNLAAERRPRLVGKEDEAHRPLLTPKAAFSADQLARVIGGRLRALGAGAAIEAALARLPGDPEPAAGTPPAKRLPYFCPGCPHNRSTRVPEGSRALAGIGCHYMAQWMERETTTFTQMGGEGASWIGQAPFTATGHVFVNLGDGTYAHSGLLAIRAAVAAGVTMTYKLLYNDAVAMTGGQAAEGGFSVARIAAQLAAEGVGAIRIVAEAPQRYRGQTLPRGVRVHPRGELERVQRALRDMRGVSVLIYDQVCAAEKRRRRKRGRMPDAGRRIVINESVCEGCGDCGLKSNCVALVPVETELGRKRQVDQTACNQDATCLEGFCPSFVTLEGARARVPATADAAPPPAPPPSAVVKEPAALVIGGVGGTGIVTLGAIIGMAAHLDGKGVSVMDQIGLAQKGGEVTTHLRIAATPEAIGTVRIARGEAGTLIGCDLLVAADAEMLALLAPGAVAIVNEHPVMTGEFTAKPDLAFPAAGMRERIAARATTAFADLTAVSTALLGNAVGANMMALGMAWQLGRVPVTAEAIHAAIELNGAAAAMNRAAFAWGRALAHDRAAVLRQLRGAGAPAAPAAATLDDIVARRAAQLAAYQGEALARRYRGLVERVRAREAEVQPGGRALAETVARAYHKLLAYKDEYEVARLHVDAGFLAELEAAFEGGRIAFHLAPPLLARRDPVTGEPRKISFGPWIVPLLRALARLKRLRGTPLDLFGYTAERRAEQRMIGAYERTAERLLAALDAANLSLAVEIAALPLAVRGFGHVKTASAARAAERERELWARWPGARP